MWNFLGSVVGGVLGNRSAKKQQAAANELNRNKIRWTVEDAKAANIHPLAALGSPVASAWATPTRNDAYATAARGAGAALAQRADRKAQSQLQGLQVENAKLQNEALRTEIMLAKATAASAAMAANSKRPAVVDSLGNPTRHHPDAMVNAVPLFSEDGSFLGWIPNPEGQTDFTEMPATAAHMRYQPRPKKGMANVRPKAAPRGSFSY